MSANLAKMYDASTAKAGEWREESDSIGPVHVQATVCLALPLDAAKIWNYAAKLCRNYAEIMPQLCRNYALLCRNYAIMPQLCFLCHTMLLCRNYAFMPRTYGPTDLAPRILFACFWSHRRLLSLGASRDVCKGIFRQHTLCHI